MLHFPTEFQIILSESNFFFPMQYGSVSVIMEKWTKTLRMCKIKYVIQSSKFLLKDTEVFLLKMYS